MKSLVQLLWCTQKLAENLHVSPYLGDIVIHIILVYWHFMHNLAIFGWSSRIGKHLFSLHFSSVGHFNVSSMWVITVTISIDYRERL